MYKFLKEVTTLLKKCAKSIQSHPIFQDITVDMFRSFGTYCVELNGFK